MSTPKKKTATSLPSKPIVFGDARNLKNGGQGKSSVNKSKKGGNSLLKKLSGK
jgi:hypothetical protein